MSLLVHWKSKHELQIEHMFGSDFPGCERCKADLQVREIAFRAALQSCCVQRCNKFFLGLPAMPSQSSYRNGDRQAEAKVPASYRLYVGSSIWLSTGQRDAAMFQVGDAMHKAMPAQPTVGR